MGAREQWHTSGVGANTGGLRKTVAQRNMETEKASRRVLENIRGIRFGTMELRTTQQSDKWRLLVMSSLSAPESIRPGDHRLRYRLSLNPIFFLEVILRQTALTSGLRQKVTKNFLTSEAIRSDAHVGYTKK